MAGRKRKPTTNLKEGEYPTRVPVETPDGDRYVIETTKMVPPSERLVAPIRQAALSEYLLSMFDGLNIRGTVGVEALVRLARMGAHRYDGLKRFCVAWEDLHQPNLFAEIYPDLAFREPTLEMVCDAAKLEPEDLVGDIWRAAYHYGSERARLQLSFHLPEVEQAAYQSALLVGREGHADRKMLLEAGKIVETGPGQVINVTNTLNSATLVQGLPKWEETDKILTAVLNPQKALPAPSGEPLENCHAEVGRASIREDPREDAQGATNAGGY